jgi:alkylation response protein AidB-like acyl-CoA dehydrogenase
MDFTFSAEQLEFRDALNALLREEVTGERIRARWESNTGWDEGLEAQLLSMGVFSLMFPESLGGLGLGMVDSVLLAEACGRVVLPEPVVETMMIVSPLLVDILDRGLGNGSVQAIVDDLMAGKSRIAVSHPINPHLNFAARADWIMAGSGDGVYLLPVDAIQLTARKSVDPSRRLTEIRFDPLPEYCLAQGEVGAALLRAVLNRGGLATAAQLLGLAENLIQQSVQYAGDRTQFGRPVGANQAVKHLLADVAVQLEYARPVIARAAYTVGFSPERADFAVSHAKLAATRVAALAARYAIQVHGAMGYTWECDVQIAAKRVWALISEWGEEGFHKNRIHEWLLQPNALIGPEYTFGRRSLMIPSSDVGQCASTARTTK